MSRTRHKSWFGVATADMFITSQHQPLGFDGCPQCARIDCRNRRCRSGRHGDYQAFEAAIIADYDTRNLWRSASWCSGSHPCCGARVVPPPNRSA